MDSCFVLLRLKKVPNPQQKCLSVKFKRFWSILTWLIELRNIELGLQAFVRLWFLKNLNIVFPLKLGGCVFRFSLFLH